MANNRTYEAIFVRAIDELVPVFSARSERIANKIVAEVKNIISYQLQKDWPTLNAKYKRRKIRLGADPRMLVAYGHYMRSIYVQKTKYGARIMINGIHPKTNISKGTFNGSWAGMSWQGQIPMAALARILEYGASYSKGGKLIWRIPPRPHWRPAIEMFRKEVGVSKKELTKALQQKLQSVLKQTAKETWKKVAFGKNYKG